MSCDRAINQMMVLYASFVHILKCIHSLKLCCFILSDIRLVEEPTEDDAKMYNDNDYIGDDLTNIEGIY